MTMNFDPNCKIYVVKATKASNSFPVYASGDPEVRADQLRRLFRALKQASKSAPPASNLP